MKTIKLNESQLRKMIRKQLDEGGWGEPGPSPMKRDLYRGAGERGAGTASPHVRGSMVEPPRGAGRHDPDARAAAAKKAIKALYGKDAVLGSDEEDDEMEDED